MSRMKDLFGDLPPSWSKPKPKTGLEIGHAKAEQAADHAGEEWKSRAYAAFVAFAKANDLFTTEEAREAANVGEPPDRRAWGAIALRAKRSGIVRPAGFTTAKDPSVHGNVVTLWESLVAVTRRGAA